MMADEEPTDGKEVYAVLSSLDRGAFPHDLDESLKRVVEQVMYTGRKGAITIKLELEPDTEVGTVKVISTITEKLPKQKKAAAIFFATPEHNLIRENPRQATMFHNEG